MEKLTIKEYSERFGKSIPRVYQMVHAKRRPLKTVKEYGRILIVLDEEIQDEGKVQEG